MTGDSFTVEYLLESYLLGFLLQIIDFVSAEILQIESVHDPSKS